MDVSVPLPISFDFAPFIGNGLQPGELPMPDDTQNPPRADPALVATIVAMGFSQAAAERVCFGLPFE